MLTQTHAHKILDPILGPYDRDQIAVLMVDLSDLILVLLAELIPPNDTHPIMYGLKIVRLIDAVPGRRGRNTLPNSAPFRAALALGINRYFWRPGDEVVEPYDKADEISSLTSRSGRHAAIMPSTEMLCAFMDYRHAWRAAVRLGAAPRSVAEQLKSAVSLPVA